MESSDNSHYQNSEEVALVKKPSESHELELTVVESAEEIKRLRIKHKQNLDAELMEKNALLAVKQNLEAELTRKNVLLADKQNLEAELTRKDALLADTQNLEAKLTRKDALLADKQNLEAESQTDHRYLNPIPSFQPQDISLDKVNPDLLQYSPTLEVTPANTISSIL